MRAVAFDIVISSTIVVAPVTEKVPATTALPRVSTVNLFVATLKSDPVQGSATTVLPVLEAT